MDKYLDTYTLRTMLKKYSEFLQFPIEMWAEKTEYEQVPDESAEVKEGEEPKMKTVPKRRTLGKPSTPRRHCG
jgi:HSP90 family molecular chaperone